LFKDVFGLSAVLFYSVLGLFEITSSFTDASDSERQPEF